MTYVLRLFDFLKKFFRLSFFSFSFLFAVVIDLLLGLLGDKKTSKKVSSRRTMTESELEESERFHFLPIPLMTPSLMIQ